MRKRTRARETALQYLYQVDLLSRDQAEPLEAFLAREIGHDLEVRDYAQTLVDGVLEHREALDKAIGRAAENWRLERMAVVDRNVLRIGAWELLFAPETPRKVAINEAINLAKRYGAEESGPFVNGILDRLDRSERGD